MKAKLMYRQPDSPLRGWAQEVHREQDFLERAHTSVSAGVGFYKQRPRRHVTKSVLQKHRRPTTPYGCVSRAMISLGLEDQFLTQTEQTLKPQMQVGSVTQENLDGTRMLGNNERMKKNPRESLASLLARQSLPVFRISTSKAGLYNKRPSIWKQRVPSRIQHLSRTALIPKLEDSKDSLSITGTNISLKPLRLSLSLTHLT